MKKELIVRNSGMTTPRMENTGLALWMVVGDRRAIVQLFPLQKSAIQSPKPLTLAEFQICEEVANSVLDKD